MVVRSTKFKFSGHQTFSFRYGWLEKGVRGLMDHPDLFKREDAIVLLGVGKNMVDSIHHWCSMAQLVDDRPDSQRDRQLKTHVSSIGEMLLGSTGWDPYMEDDASLWLVHWLMISNLQARTTSQLAFSDFNRNDFSKRELTDFVSSVADRNSVRVTDATLNRDIDCFLRSYVSNPRPSKKMVLEESFECPLQELGLLQVSPDGEFYRFVVGAKPTLPAAVFGYALSDYFRTARGDRMTMSIQECLYGPGSPGQAFKLDENSLVNYLDDLEELTSGALLLDDTAGLKQIYQRRAIEGTSLLSGHYRKEAAR